MSKMLKTKIWLKRDDRKRGVEERVLTPSRRPSSFGAREVEVEDVAPPQAAPVPASIFKPKISPEDESQLEFERKKMVNWFDPSQLVRTGLKVLLSGIFGAYSDRREIQAALHPIGEDTLVFHDCSHETSTVVDFIADVGDGWDSTYTMAWLLAQKSLKPTGSNVELPRGEILVLGGDEVYPTAKREEYQNRFFGPYESALPRVDDGDGQPYIFAIPGNHDWYDGLTSFLRLFCQERRIGQWRTQQNKSYFAIKLPHNWWLWGIDIQFEADIDKPQIEYFQAVAEHMLEERKGNPEIKDRIILVNASPSWTEREEKKPSPYQNLEFFVYETVLKFGGEVPVMLTGDLHHYCRYSTADGKRQYITSGGGGAYLYATHRMEDKIKLEVDRLPDRTIFNRVKVFPSDSESRGLRYGIMKFPILSWKFSGLLAFLYALFAWILESASYNAGNSNSSTFIKTIATKHLSDVTDVAENFFNIIHYSPGTVMFMLILVAGLIGFSDVNSRFKSQTARKVWRLATGFVHAVAHIVLNVALIWGLASINSTVDVTRRWLDPGPSYHPLAYAFLFSAEMLIAGGVLGGWLMGGYLLLNEFLAHAHTNEVFSAQRLTAYKNFLRMRIDENGTLTIFPIGVREVCKKWKYKPGVSDGSSWFAPETEIKAELIEEPIVLTRGN